MREGLLRGFAAVRGARRKTHLARRIAWRMLRRDLPRYIVAVLVLALPLSFILVGVSAWIFTSSPRYAAAHRLRTAPGTQAFAIRVSNSPITQDSIGRDITFEDGGGTGERKAEGFGIGAWVPEGDTLDIVERVDSARVFVDRALISTNVEGVVQTSNLSLLGEELADIDPRLPSGRAIISADIARELDLAEGSVISVETTANASRTGGIQTSTATIDRIIDADRRLIIGPDTLDLVTGGLGDGSSTEFYIKGPEPVRWEDVQSLNAHGFLVVSKHVLGDPPPAEERSAEESAALRWRLFVFGFISLPVFTALVLIVSPIYANAQSRGARISIVVSLNGGTRSDRGRILLALAMWVGVLADLVSLALVALGCLGLSRWTGVDVFPFLWRMLILAGFVPGLLSLAAAIFPARDFARQSASYSATGNLRTISRFIKPQPLYPALFPLALAILILAAARGSLILLALGTALLETAVVGTIPYIFSGRWRLSSRDELVWRFATRDVVRNGNRSLPAVAALITTLFIASVILIVLRSTNEGAWASNVHIGPKGSVYVQSADAAPSSFVARFKQHEAAAEINRRHPVVEHVELRGLQWRGGIPGPRLSVEAVSPDGRTSPEPQEFGSALEEMDVAYIVDDGTFLRASGIAKDKELASAVQTLNRGGALIPDASFIGESGLALLQMRNFENSLRATEQELAEIPAPEVLSTLLVPASPTPSLNVVVLSPEAAKKLNAPSRPLAQLLILDKPVNRYEATWLKSVVSSAAPGTRMEAVLPDSTLFLLSWGAQIIALVAVLGTVSLSVVLAASDIRKELYALGAVGANPKLVRKVFIYEGLGMTLVSVPIAQVLGAFVGVVSILTIAKSGLFPSLTGLKPVVPWIEMLLLLVITPLLATLISMISAPRSEEVGAQTL